jgi:hypothetical protein
MPQPLDYSPVWPQPARSLKNAYRRLAAAAVAFLLLMASFVILPWFSRHNELMRLQANCMRHAAPSTRVVSKFNSSSINSSTTQPAAASPWTKFNGLLSGTYTAFPELYLHQRLTPAGERFLLCLRVINTDEEGLLLEQNVARPGGWLRNPKMIHMSMNHLSLPSASSRVIYAGQSDPNNASHFTISYSADARPGLIDGWLENDGTIRLELRQ